MENLLQVRNDANDLYLIAVLYDPNPKINTWITQELRAQPVAASVRERFLKVSAGMDMETGMAPAPASTPGPAGTQSKVQDLKVEQLSNDVNVEEVYFLKDEEKASKSKRPHLSMMAFSNWKNSLRFKNCNPNWRLATTIL